MRATAVVVVAMVGAVAFAMAPGCSLINTCGHPDEQELSCHALPPDSTEIGCTGRPSSSDLGPSTHVDERYAIGCVVRNPACDAAFPDSTQTCVCERIGSDGPRWVCPR